MCAMELRLRLKRSPPQAGIEPGTARSVGQRLTHWATRAPRHLKNIYFGIRQLLGRLTDLKSITTKQTTLKNIIYNINDISNITFTITDTKCLFNYDVGVTLVIHMPFINILYNAVSRL